MMPGRRKLWFALATWVLWSLVAAPAGWLRPTMAYDTLRFNTKDATKDSYSRFIKDIRNHLFSGSLTHDIPLLRLRSQVPANQRFLLLDLTNQDGETITVAIDTTDVYVVAYRVGDRSFFLSDAPPEAATNLFPGTTQQTLPMGSRYGDLEGRSRNRRNIELGITDLGHAITMLYDNRDREVPQNELASSFIVLIEMIPEAVRFTYNQQRVRDSITGPGQYRSFLPDATMLTLQNKWDTMSTRVQGSQGGAFSTAVRLQRPGYDWFEVDNVANRFLMANLALMLNCGGQFNLPRLIRSAAASENSNDDSDTCHIYRLEPTVRIRGRNNYCVDARDGQFNDGNPVQLWPCNFNIQKNQIWTLKSDGTIQANGKCLTTYGYSPGSYVMIYNCATAVRDATIWEVWNNGTIINPTSQLVLSAQEGKYGTTLTLQTNTYAPGQGWFASNNLDPLVTSIVGLKDLCLQANGESVWLEACSKDEANQKWAFYPDGSIRSETNEETCLTCANDSAGTLITIASCTLGMSGQRWMFTNDKQILNLNNKMVMDVKGSDPSLHQIIIWTPNYNPNQEWLPLP